MKRRNFFASLGALFAAHAIPLNLDGIATEQPLETLKPVKLNDPQIIQKPSIRSDEYEIFIHDKHGREIYKFTNETPVEISFETDTISMGFSENEFSPIMVYPVRRIRHISFSNVPDDVMHQLNPLNEYTITINSYGHVLTEQTCIEAIEFYEAKVTFKLLMGTATI